MVMYSLNYLFSPAIQYEVTQAIAVYKMKITPAEYFPLAIGGIFCFHAGLYSIKTKIFTGDFITTGVQKELNERILKQWLIGGLALTFLGPFFPGELSFVAYLLSSIKYIGAFGLFIIAKKKYKWYLIGILLLEVINALRSGMFHDMVVWVLFFGMVWTFLNKPNFTTKLSLSLIAVFALFTLQSVKSTYRQQLQAGGGGITSFSSAVSSQNSSEGGLLNLTNLASSITRANQGVIFASSVKNMDTKQNFQDLNLVKLYAEAAILPRVLAANKLEAGDIKIFNQFSGIRVLKGTSMGLGVFADGYIAYGKFGTLIFAFVFGLMCAGVFKICERWSAISPFFILFCFPLLNYAVRADCETQTWMGHIIKGLIIFGILIYFTKRYFVKRIQYDETPEEPKVSLSPQLIPNSV